MAVTNSRQVVVNNGNVSLVDPNLVNVNTEMVNSIPQYQDMFIYAELTAELRQRTVLVTGLDGTGSYSNQDNGNNKGNIVVNFIGNNQDPKNPNNLNFTTNWYDGSSEEGKQFEGFGISSIKVVINSSFIPQINIQFIDVRGLAFFNQTNSPYRMLFSFPPPVFKLKLKGYYGKPLTYKLHLVNYSSEFRAENGNFVIDAQFIALTYAPLTDILFRYVVNFPLIDNTISINPNPNQEPTSTYELIMKLKSLYSQYSEKKNTDNDSQIYNNTLNSMSNITEAISILNGYKQNDLLKSVGTPMLLVKNKSYVSDGGQELMPIQSVVEYDNTIKKYPTDGLSNSIDQRLFVAYLMNESIIITGDTFNLNNDTKKNYLMHDILDVYRKDLISKTIAKLGAVIEDSDIPLSIEFQNNQNVAAISPSISNVYVGLDVTNYYIKLYKEKTSLQKTKVDAMTNMNEKINNMVMESLGMKPTIYNVFKIILNDVDKFFNILRKCSYDAENDHHVRYRTQIINDNFKDVTKNGDKDKIYAFPLIIKQEKVCNQIKETRTAPIEFNYTLPEKFPEIVLIEKFIDTFLKQQKITELYNMRAEQNADGSFKWIPISPVDSRLATSDLLTPYYGVDNTNGGSETQIINISSDPRLKQVFQILMNRFYILSQNSLATGFYESGKGETELVKMYARAEAVNLAASITNTEYTNLLSNAAKAYSNDATAFYDYLKKFVPDYYEFTQAQTPSLKISNGNNLFTDKNNDGYVGFQLYSDAVSLQTTETAGSDNLVIKFQKDATSSWWRRFLNGGKPLQTYYKFTEENVFYIKDGSVDASNVSSTGIDVNTRYVAPANTINNDSNGNVTLGKVFTFKKSDLINTIVNGNGKPLSDGNFAFGALGVPPINGDYLSGYGDISFIWSNQLTKCDTQIYNTIINPTPANRKLSALILLSNFGFALSPFNIYPLYLNKSVFTTPAAVEIPYYLAPYLGVLVGIEKNDAFYNQIYNFFMTGDGINLDSSGAFILADIIDVNKYLASADKLKLQLAFKTFFGDTGGEGTMYNSILQQLKILYDAAQVAASGSTSGKKDMYTASLKSDGRYFSTILQPLITRMNLINFNQITFNPTIVMNKGYISVSTINANATSATATAENKTKKDVNDAFFKEMFQELSTRIKEKENKLISQEQENKKLTGDDDIVTQAYYSFKNINDKWLSSPKTANLNSGYPFNDDSGLNSSNLIDSFVFVDRAMNPIGDTIINPEDLVDLLEDQNVTVFSVLARLLSKNGFEFFPLQNFMNYGGKNSNNKWEDSFKIDTDNVNTQNPTFVCMYIGGGSSYPSGIESMGGQFKDDGIVDISNPGVPDFSLQGCEPVPTDDSQTIKNTKFPFRQVRAFRVRFAEQNQSMFSNIKIDSKEYPETNESINILSRLAGDNKLQAPAPKGQNLYNLYENRSYKATITGLGNVMIQPTQYFQVENVPLYSGAYIILGVEHSVEPNKMTTSFYGTKILKYPVPRVLQSSSIVGFEGGNTEDTSIALASANDVTLGVGSAGNPIQAQYNSMYYFKIQ